MDIHYNAKTLYKSMKAGNHYQTVNNESRDFYFNDVKASEIAHQAVAKATPTTHKLKFEPLTIDNINHKSRNNIAPELDGRNIEVLTGIKESQVAYKPHNIYKSDFLPIDYF